MQDNLYTFYQERIGTLTDELTGLKKRIHLIGSLRLAIVVAAGFTLYFSSTDSKGLAFICLLFALPFIGLMIYHNRLFERRRSVEILIDLNQNELKAIDNDYSAFDGAEEEKDPSHSFSLDLDLFGEHSLFQAINRTVTDLGREKLIEWMKQPANNKEEILNRQDIIRELSSKPEMFQHFYMIGKQNKGKRADKAILNQVSESFDMFTSTIWKVFIWLIPAIWAILLALVLLHALPESSLGIYFAFSLVISYWKSGNIQKIHHQVDQLEHLFSSYADLIHYTEKNSFKCAGLQQLQNAFCNSSCPASKALKELSRHIGALNQRFSAIGVLMNILFMRDTRRAIALEVWKHDYGKEMIQWLDALAEWDAYYSLGQFAFNHPDYSYPTIADSYFKMEGEALGHPLLSREICVKNDINIPQSPSFLIITGANMAGKSTYLRTIGCNFLLACIGLPACAKRLTIYPARLVTSLRTSDSLASNESYFFAELKRIKMIIDRISKGEELFIILDEILKGTNSIDKQKGSIDLLKRFVAEGTCGIIATHDLILGSLENEFPDKVKNYCFEADIVNDKLSFTYKLREGVAKNMNASFLIHQLLNG